MESHGILKASKNTNPEQTHRSLIQAHSRILTLPQHVRSGQNSLVEKKRLDYMGPFSVSRILRELRATIA